MNDHLKTQYQTILNLVKLTADEQQSAELRSKWVGLQGELEALYAKATDNPVYVNHLKMRLYQAHGMLLVHPVPVTGKRLRQSGEAIE